MRMTRVVDSVALVALLPIAGVVACGAESGTDQNPAPLPQYPYPGQTPGPGPSGPPIVGGGPPIAGQPTSNPTSPVPTNQPPGPVPTNQPPGPVPTNQPPGPVPTGTTPVPVPTSTTPVPVPTTPPPEPGGLPAPAYDAQGILIAPDPAIGYQVSTPAFTLQPGQEQFRCYHTSIPTPTEMPVGRWVSQMSPGSHHFILYAGGSAPDGQFDADGCGGGLSGGQWVYASSKPDNQMPMPEGVAMPMAANQKINFDMHYINTGSSVLNAQVRLNIERTQSPNPQRAGALISFNTSIRIPANGAQTVSGTCAVPAGANFFILSTHTHKYATVASIRDGSATGTELVHTTDWENPDTKVWLQAPFYNFSGSLHYSCTYQNTTSQVITVGESAARNEMCMAVTYFFPANSGSQFCSPF
jgi:hypothetical protein